MTPEETEAVCLDIGTRFSLSAHVMGAIFEAIRDAVRNEREACALIALQCGGDFEKDTAARTETAVRAGIAKLIRAPRV